MDTTILRNVAQNFKKIATKRSPEILTGVGIAGMITTVVLSVKATPTALQLIEEEKQKQNLALINSNEPYTGPIDNLSKKDTVKTVWKCYVPAIVTGTVSAACIVGATSVNARRNTALATAYALSETALKEYRSKVVETVGEKKEQKVRDAIAKDRIEQNPVSNSQVIITSKGETLCYDAHSGRYFKSDMDTLNKIVNVINQKLISDSYVPLNEFYFEVGLSSTVAGRDLGWRIDQGLLELYFSSQIADDGTPCLVIDYSISPKYDYDKWL